MVLKIELHTHLEGTAPPSLIRKIAARNKVALTNDLFTEDGNHFAWDNFLDFLNAFDKATKAIKKPIDYYDITYEYLKAAAKENTIYAETMYSPEHAERASNIPSIEHLHAIQQAVDDAKAKYNIIGSILITAVRHFGVDAVNKVANHAAQVNLPCIKGFAMGGDEAGFPPAQFKRAYQIASESGLGCTVHAGEICGPQSIIEALDNLPVTRIGHGVRAIEDPRLLARIKGNNIHLELCPTSNICTRVYQDLKSHPFKRLFALCRSCGKRLYRLWSPTR